MPDFKLVLLSLLLALPATAVAQDSQQRGLEIALAADAYDKGFVDFFAPSVYTVDGLTMTVSHESNITYSVNARTQAPWVARYVAHH